MRKNKTAIKEATAAPTSRLQKMIDSMELVKMRVSDLVPWEENPRIHGDIDALVQSMSRFGVFSPILAQKGTNRILAGHRRYKAAVRDGLEVVPVILFEIDDIEASGYTIADNAIAEQSKWDFSPLKNILDGLKIEGFDLSVTGISLESFDEQPAEEPREIPEDEGIAYHPRYAVIVMCSDDTEQQAVYDRLNKQGYNCKVVVT